MTWKNLFVINGAAMVGWAEGIAILELTGHQFANPQLVGAINALFFVAFMACGWKVWHSRPGEKSKPAEEPEINEYSEATHWHLRMLAGDLHDPETYKKYYAWRQREHAKSVEITERAYRQHQEGQP